jgi:hypothetical protein
MLAAPVFGIFMIPMLCVVFQQLRAWAAGSLAPAPIDGATPKTSAPEIAD